MSRARWLGLQGWLAAVMVSVGFAASLAVLVTVLPTLEQTIRRDRAGEIAGHITQVVRSHQPDNLTPVIADWDQIADGIGDDLGGGQVRISADGVVRGQSRTCCALLDSFPPLGPRDGGQSQLTASGNALRVRVPLQVSNTFAQIATVGMTADIAADVWRAHGPEMGRAILALYRSAPRPADVGRLENAAARPGLSVLCPADTFVGSDEIRRRAADRAGARTAVLDGLGHYWMIEDPANSAAVLSEFWNSID